MSETTFYGIISTVLATIAIVIAYYAIKVSKNIAKNQGAFKKPNLEISLFNLKNEENIILALPLLPNVTVEIELTYNILNSGEASAKDVEVYLQNKSNDLRLGNILQLTASGTAKEFKLIVDKETDHTQTLIGSIQSLHPEQMLTLNDKITVKSPTIYKENVSVTTKDNKSGSVDVWFNFAYVLDFSIKSLDHPTINKKINFSIINTYPNSAKEFFDEYNQVQLKDYKKAKLAENYDKRFSVSSKDAFHKTFKLLIVETDKLELENMARDKTEKIKGNSMRIYDGFSNEMGYFIPSIKVIPTESNQIN
jgi:hypothetical protein